MFYSLTKQNLQHPGDAGVDCVLLMYIIVVNSRAMERDKNTDLHRKTH